MRKHGWIAIVALTVSVACSGRDSESRLAAPAPHLADVQLPRETRVVAARVSAGSTLASVLRANAIAERDIADVIARARNLFDLRKVRTLQPYRLEQGPDGSLRRFEYELDADRFLRVTRGDVLEPAPDGCDASAGPCPFVAELLPIEKTRVVTLVRGTIDRDAPSLFAAMDAAGETVDLSVALATIFAGELDFHVDLRPGDRFEVLVEKHYREGGKLLAGYGPILAAEFENAGRALRAIRFTPDGGVPGYYDQRGTSMRRFFLQSPLKFAPVVSSGFSRSRFHPILREYRPHLGVDYKAPFGAPVVSVADGVVVEATVKGGAGRMVHVRHANGFESEYLHLSSIAVRPGVRVRQGELVGRVGASGLATGPHLDYRLKRNGMFVNPLTVHRSMPPAAPVPASQMAAFAATRDRVLTAFGSQTTSHTAASATDQQ